MNKLIKVHCPQCKLEFDYYQSQFRPFCSEKCKMIDLGHWFEESYKVPGKEGEPSELEITSIEEELEGENYEN